VVITDPQNTAVGDQALFSNFGQSNTATGFHALFSNSKDAGNVANGDQALAANDTGTSNTAVGSSALSTNADGSGNTAVGSDALFANVGGDNSALGTVALRNNTTGGNNTAVGVFALFGNTTGDSNVAIGRNAGNHVITANHVIAIGADVPGTDMSNSCFIGNIFGQTSSGGIAVFVDPDGKLGTITSSRRFKEEIEPMDQASELLFSLKPVSFHYKKEIDPHGTSQLGLLAEDVEKVNPDLIVRDREGNPYTVRYDAVNAMLLNEFLKEHRKVEKHERKIEEQGTTIAELKTEMKALAATVNEQTSELRKVSAQIEMRQPEPQLAQNQH
jgi:hypothetical protein